MIFLKIMPFSMKMTYILLLFEIFVAHVFFGKEIHLQQ